MTAKAQGVGETPENRSRYLQRRGAELARENDIDVEAFNISGNLHMVFTLMKAMAERGPLAEAKLSMTAFIALWSIWVNGDMEGKEVAAEIGIARSSYSELAQRLVQRGLLSRQEDPTDGRVVLFRVTELGASTVEETWRLMNAEMKVMVSGFEAGERTELADNLQRLADQLILMSS